MDIPRSGASQSHSDENEDSPYCLLSPGSHSLPGIPGVESETGGNVSCVGFSQPFAAAADSSAGTSCGNSAFSANTADSTDHCHF